MPQKRRALYLTVRVCNHMPSNSLIPASTVHHPLDWRNKRFRPACLPAQDTQTHTHTHTYPPSTTLT